MKVSLKLILLTFLLASLATEDANSIDPEDSLARDLEQASAQLEADETIAFSEFITVAEFPFGIELTNDLKTTAILSDLLDVSQQHVALLLSYVAQPNQPLRLVKGSRLGMGKMPENEATLQSMKAAIGSGNFAGALAAYEGSVAAAIGNTVTASEAVLVEVLAQESTQAPRLVIGTWLDAAGLLSRDDDPDIQTVLHLLPTSSPGLFRLKSASVFKN